MTRDIAYSAVRFYTPEPLDPQTRLETEWDLAAGHVLCAPMVVVRTLPGLSVYRAIPGYDVVARWAPSLPEEVEAGWRRFCDQHRYD